MNTGTPDIRLDLAIGSGILAFPSFSQFHEAASELLGCPLYTHEFGLEETWLELKIALEAKRLGVPYGAQRKMGPLDSGRKMAPDKPVLAVDARRHRVSHVPAYPVQGRLF